MNAEKPFNLVIVSGGTSEPSSTRMLADRIAQQVTKLGAERGSEVRIQAIDLRDLATEIGSALVSQLLGPKLRAAVELLLLMESGFAQAVRQESWRSYQHEFGSAGRTELGIDLSSDLMRLAAGGAPRGASQGASRETSRDAFRDGN